MFAGWMRKLSATSLRTNPCYHRHHAAVTIQTFSSKSSPLGKNNKNATTWGPFAAFRDSVPRQLRSSSERVGRSWSAVELRRKSYDDLHKLWYVLYKERNMLLTEQQISRRKKLIFPQPERMKKVRKSMGAIKQVLGERKRAHLAYLEEQKNQQDDLNPSVANSNDHKMDDTA